ncbi:hypothetical protein [Vannielia litorea]|uniref:hypothetical protein n=1 Tax=Vannielia litorea TaxID=1217970 RepID=UPI001C93B2D4|nr:hypothetical protein [Vannielia litorea]MBY6047852.1 hypothetical protein [Vannielia litorea]MBY6075266.1 hypothetical protein [Vannielia litorea]
MPRRKVRRAAQIADRLSRPARVAFLGLPAGQQVARANAVLGQGLVDPAWPTCRLIYGEALAFTARLSDRRVVAGEGLPDLASFPVPPAFLEIAAPIDLLKELTLLVVRAGTPWQEQQAALHWAARQTDIALWCAAEPMEAAEFAIWQAAPQALANHSYLLSPGRCHAEAEAAFGNTVSTDAPDWPDRLRASLATLTREARQEDADIGALVLRDVARIMPRKREEGVLCVASQPEAAAPDGEPPAVETKPEADRAPEAWRLASKLLLTLRRGAAEVLDLLNHDTSDDALAAEILERAERLLSALKVLLTDVLQPPAELTDLMAEAEETLILLKYEGGLDQAVAAASVLVQVRQAIETHLEKAA